MALKRIRTCHFSLKRHKVPLPHYSMCVREESKTLLIRKNSKFNWKKKKFGTREEDSNLWPYTKEAHDPTTIPLLHLWLFLGTSFFVNICSRAKMEKKKKQKLAQRRNGESNPQVLMEPGCHEHIYGSSLSF